MNMAGVVQAPKRATLAPAAATPADRLAAMRGEERRGSRPTDTRREEMGRPVVAASHSAQGRDVPQAHVGHGLQHHTCAAGCLQTAAAPTCAMRANHQVMKPGQGRQAGSRTRESVADEEHHAAAGWQRGGFA